MKHTFGIALRVNSFLATKTIGSYRKRILDALSEIAAIDGVTHLELNYPDHVVPLSHVDITTIAKSYGKAISGFAMRFNEPTYANGAYTHPSRTVRNSAVALTKRAIDAVRTAGGDLLTIWPGSDGFDRPYSVDYERQSEWFTEAIHSIASYDPGMRISLEYKPFEPRAFSILPSMASSLLVIRHVGMPNVGVTLDYCHALCAKELPAAAATYALKDGVLFGVHLNDGHGIEDDGLPVASVDEEMTKELLENLIRYRYTGILYFDTFPKGIDPVAESKRNIETVRRLLGQIGSPGKRIRKPIS